jgi:ABC-type nitrate/sulfonate/bicarbonate transport system substrate-binding protein
MAKRSFLDANRAAASNFLKAVIEGLYLLKKDKPLGVRLIKKYLRLNDEAASIGYDFYIAKHGEGMLSLPERQGMEFVIAEVAKSNPAASKATPESLRLVEPSLLDEIRKSGFLQRFK